MTSRGEASLIYLNIACHVTSILRLFYPQAIFYDAVSMVCLSLT